MGIAPVHNINDFFHCLQVKRGGEMTGGVVSTTPYLTVHLLSVILTESARVVTVTIGTVVARQVIALFLVVRYMT